MKRLTACLLALLLFAGAVQAEKTDQRTVEDVYIENASMGKLYGELKCPGEGPCPLVILSHGFGGNHQGNNDYAEYFLKQGFATFNLDFCGGGWGSKSDGTMTDMSVLTEAKDLEAVIDRFRDDPRFTCIYLWGASQGGFVSSYVAAKRPEDVKALVIEFPAYVLQDDAKEKAAPDGSFPETSQVLGAVIGRIYNEDAVSFDIYDVLPGYGGDVLILHGDRDAIVPLTYSQRAAEAFPHAELIVMKGQNHGFMGAARRNAMELEAKFLLAHEQAAEEE